MTLQYFMDTVSPIGYSMTICSFSFLFFFLFIYFFFNLEPNNFILKICHQCSSKYTNVLHFCAVVMAATKKCNGITFFLWVYVMIKMNTWSTNFLEKVAISKGYNSRKSGNLDRICSELGACKAFTYTHCQYVQLVW